MLRSLNKQDFVIMDERPRESEKEVHDHFHVSAWPLDEWGITNHKGKEGEVEFEEGWI